MNDYNELDNLIEKYSGELISFGAKHGHTQAETSEKAQPVSTEVPPEKQETAEETQTEENNENELYSDSAQQDEDIDEEKNLYSARRLPKQEEKDKKEKEEAVPPLSENPKAEPENYATFTARIFAAEGAFPVEGARVTLKKQGEIHAYLITNGSGETKQILLESYPEENSLEPLNPDKEMIYSADISADGFESKKDLPVFAVGGSDIVLQQFLVPREGS